MPRKRQLPPEDLAPEEGGLVPPEATPEPEPVTDGRERKKLALEVELNPASLVGSTFIRVENGEAVWWGVIVGEPQAGMYLCQVDSGLPGGKAQVVFSLERMESKDEGYEFRFFDTEEAMRDAFAAMTSAERRVVV
jgi:hypothetical protein